VKFNDLKKNLQKLNLKDYDGTHLDSGTIVDAQKFVDTHISFLETNSGNITYICYYKRLLQFYKQTKTQNNDELQASINNVSEIRFGK